VSPTLLRVVLGEGVQVGGVDIRTHRRQLRVVCQRLGVLRTRICGHVTLTAVGRRYVHIQRRGGPGAGTG
jgi:hypothetical protein